MKSLILNTLIMLSLVVTLATGCTTATYGVKPELVPSQADTFTFKVFTGGFAAGDTADQRATQELNQYRSANGYKSYVIINKEFKPFPLSGFVYTVKFTK